MCEVSNLYAQPRSHKAHNNNDLWSSLIVQVVGLAHEEKAIGPLEKPSGPGGKFVEVVTRTRWVAHPSP